MSHAKRLGPLWVHLSDHICPCNCVNYMSIIEPIIIAKVPSVTLKYMGDHKVLDLWSKDQINNFQTFVGDAPFIRCLREVTMHLLSLGIEQKT